MALAIFSAALLLPGWEWVRGKEKSDQPLDGTSLTVTDQEGTAEEPSDGEQIFSRPDEMKAVTLTPGVDYAAGEELDADGVADEIDSLLDSAQEMGMNTVLLPLLRGEKSIHPSLYFDALLPDTDLLASLLQGCAERGLYAYPVVDLGVRAEGASALPTSAEEIAYMAGRAGEIARGYQFAGLLLSGYENAASAASYQAYRQSGGGEGLEDWLRQGSSSAVQGAARQVKTDSPQVQLGLLVGPVWAHASQLEGGSETGRVPTAYFDSCADTRQMATSGLFDFLAVDMPYATADPDAPFGALAAWWKGALTADEGAATPPIYALLHNEKVLGKESGWGAPDQLIRQVMAARENQLAGCAFGSFQTLRENPGKTTDKLLQYYRDELNPNTILKELSVDSPRSADSVTYEPVLTLYGGGDPNFDLTINGETVPLNDKGLFSVERELKVGANTFTFEHKGKTATYTVTRRVKVLQSVSPSGSVRVPGGTSIKVTAVAYAGSAVTASLGGSSVRLKEVEAVDDSEEGTVDSYKTFEGVLPTSVSAGDQKLGNISVSASWSGYSEKMSGGSVTVTGAGEAPPAVVPGGGDSSSSSSGDSSSSGGSSSSGDASSTPSENLPQISGNLAIITASDGEAEGYSPSVNSNYSDPSCFPLAKGAQVFVKGEKVTCSDAGYTDSYYNLGSGTRVEARDIQIKGQATVDANVVRGVSFANTGGVFRMTVSQDWAAPTRITLEGNTLTVRLYYKTGYRPCLELPANSVFSAAQWVTAEDGADAIRFTLKSGQFRGLRQSYQANGDLVVDFNNVLTSLSGMRVYVDPGHGGSGDPGAVNGPLQEAAINKAIADKLVAELQGRGAVVKLGSRAKDLSARVREANSFGADLLVSIHQNSTTGASARGAEVWYFNPYSKTIASTISSRVATANLSGIDRGAKFGYMAVTRQMRYPAVLVECGFLSDATEGQNLANAAVQEKIAKAIADGIAAGI